RQRRIDRIGDGVARLDEHRAAAGDAPHHLDAVALRGVAVHLVAQRLEAADHHRGGRPFPQAHRGLATARADRVKQSLVQRHVQQRRLRCRVDQLPVVVAPVTAAHAGAPSCRARRSATTMAALEMPYIVVPAGRAASMAVPSVASSMAMGWPSSTALIAGSAASGSRKKSPLSRTPAKRPSRKARSTTTSLPPGILYSPCIACAHPWRPAAPEREPRF